MEQRIRRILYILMAFLLGFALLILQLMFLQLFHMGRYVPRRADLTAAAVEQRMHGVVLDEGRGRILDRHGRPLTGFVSLALAVEPRLAAAWSQQHVQEAENLRKLLGMHEAEWHDLLQETMHITLWRRERRPVVLTAEQAKQVEHYGPQTGIYAVPYVRRYEEPFYASQLIGYLSQHPSRARELYGEEIAAGALREDLKIGASGLERSFEHVLRSRGTARLGIFTDARNRPLAGLNLRIVNTNSRFYPVRVVTTLDLELQARIEQLLDERGVKRASVVLLDPSTADVLVMANRPNFHPEQIDLEAGYWENASLKQQIPGSIFKIAVAAAALEYGVISPHERFICLGEYGKYGFSCWKRGGHGKLTLQEAFAQSCNIAFADIAKRLTPERIRTAAERLGLGRRIGWEGKVRGYAGLFRQFDGEEQGQFFAASPIDEGVLIQSAIGQRDVRLTPLQAANMIVTLLQGGRLTSPRIVREVRFNDGSLMMSFPIQRAGSPPLSKRTAKALLAMMQETVHTGTARMLADHVWRLAGKTGTAELGRQEQGVHHWFVGFGPVHAPKVAAAVVVYDQPAASRNEAAALFAEVMNIVRETWMTEDH